jgi:WD40 repeat protein/serine/threonine protein kinase
MSTMNVDALQAKAVFLQAVEEHDPGDWPSFLDQACPGDPELRNRVELLLNAHLEADTAAHQSRDRAAPTAVATEPEQPGKVVGPYKLVQQIGEGGMGTVWMAQQTKPVKRVVALKLIKAGMDSKAVIARFEAERQALALMEHANIARVLDAGTSDGGRPYFVMDLVRGVPITKYCDEHHFTPRQRLELFIPVCQAVQHAHQKGIIHRDLKPSNVLVALYDGRPVPKVIDFGVAKAAGQSLTEKTLVTGFGAIVGTLEYMSPEQAEINQLDIDTRSDIYALGVLLYELLTGTTPLERSRLDTGLLELLRSIREDETLRPSLRLSTIKDLPQIASRRGVEPKKLSGLVRGELDWIVMKALEKDRTRRYESVGAFAADVQRYLHDEPVLACPPSAMYRFGKFARRNKAALATALVVGLAVVGLATSLVQIASDRYARHIAEEERKKADEERKKADERERRESYFHRITLADRYLALDVLEQCPKDLRGWEWYYLMRLCRFDPLVIPDRTTVNGVAFSPDGERIASAGGDRTIKIWNSRTSKEVQRLPAAHSDAVVCVAFHPDGKHLASTGADRKVKVWDLTTEREVFGDECTAIRKLGTASTVAFRPPDGRHLAVCNEEEVRVWDWEQRQLIHALPGHEFHSIPVAFSPDGRLLATGGSRRKHQRVWDLEAGREPIRFFPAHPHPVTALAFSPDGTRLASASFGRSVHVCDTATGERLLDLLHTGNVNGVAFSPDGQRLASCGEDRTVRVWDAATGREVLGLRGHTALCGCVAFSPDGHRLASASIDGTIRVWDATPLREGERRETLTFDRHDDEVHTVAVSPDGRWVASAGYDALVKVWDARTGEVRATLSGHTILVFSIAWQPDGRRVAAAGSDGQRHTVRVWDAATGQQAFEIPAGPDHFSMPYSAVAFRPPDGRYLVTGKADALQVWDARTGKSAGELGTNDRDVRGVVFSRDGRHLASTSGNGNVKFWDATGLPGRQEARLTLPARVPGPRPCLNVAFSPDGRRLVTGGPEHTVKIWDVRDGQILHTLRGHSGDVHAVAFSPDDESRWVASGGEDGTVKVWDSRSGELVDSFRGHTGLISSLAFSPDGLRLYSGSRDRTVKAWDLKPLDEVRKR